MTAMSRIISTALLLAMVLACGPPRFAWEGTWRGNRDLEGAPGEDATIAYSLGRVEVVIRGDRFEASDGGIPKTGFVRARGNEATLRILTIFNRDIAKMPDQVRKEHPDMILHAQEDGSVLFVSPAAFGGEPVRLEKVEPEA
jgi:hypothetical protein